MRSVSDWLNARGYPCAKGDNSIASQWLSGEQMRLCSGHSKVHFVNIVVGFWKWEGGGGGCTETGGEGGGFVLLALSLTLFAAVEQSSADQKQWLIKRTMFRMMLLQWTAKNLMKRRKNLMLVAILFSILALTF